ncbi:two component system sensor histidine kinase, hybrid [Desulfosarcina variabilis str. Montpellier]
MIVAQIRRKCALGVFMLTIGVSILLATGTVIRAAEEMPAPRKKNSKQVLIINSYIPDMPWQQRVNQSITATLKNDPHLSIDIHTEYTGLSENVGADYVQKLIDLYRYKYAGRKIDLVISVDIAATNLMIVHGKTLFPGAALAFLSGNENIRSIPLMSNMTGIIAAIDVKGTLDIALKLHPGTRNIAIISGSSDTDRQYGEIAWNVLKGYKDRVKIIDLTALAMDALLHQASRLPDHTVALYVLTLMDGAGEAFIPKMILPELSRTINAPMYGLWDALLGSGIVGGNLSSAELAGIQIAEMGLRILNGTSPATIPLASGATVYLFDWRQLERWQIREADLPAGSIVREKKLSVWNLYKWQIIGVTGLVLIEGLLLFILLIHRNRRRHAERSLQQARDELKSILSKTPDIIYRLDPQGNVTYISDAVKNFGYQPDDLIGKPFTDFFHPDNNALAGHGLRERRTGERSTQALEVRFMIRPSEKVQNSSMLMDSGWSTFLVSSDGLYADDIVSPETYQGTQGLAHDISRTRQIETRVAQLASVVEQAAEDVVILDPEGVIQYVNPRFEEVTGYSRAEVIGQTLRILKSDRHEAAFYAQIRRTIESGKIWEGRIWNRTKDGRLILQDVTTTPIYDPAGKLSGHASVRRDITKQMEIEEQLRQSQKMEAIGRLAGGIAHDFNNILSAIIGYADLALADVAGNEAGKKKIGRILDASSRATELIKQILSFSRSQETNPRPVSPRIIVKEVLKFMRASLPATIEIRQDLNSQNTVLADPIGIHQIVMNLCTNAGHAMSKAGGLLTVSVEDVTLTENEVANHPGMAAGNFIKISVADTGHGISPDIQNKIFDPFFTTKAQGEGTGMGLSTVHGTVRNLGGMVIVTSRPDEGSVFSVFLPMISEPIEVVDRLEPDTALGGTERILFVDDELIQGELARDALGPLGYRVRVFSDSITAWEHFQSHADEYDIVITDLTMPKMTGDILTRHIHRLRPQIPVIMCTGFSEAVDQKQIEAMGLRALLHKPIIARDLTRVIRGIMD